MWFLFISLFLYLCVTSCYLRDSLPVFTDVAEVAAGVSGAAPCAALRGGGCSLEPLWGRGNDPDAKLLALVTQWDTCPAAPAVKATRLLKSTQNVRLASLLAATLLGARYAKCCWMLICFLVGFFLSDLFDASARPAFMPANRAPLCFPAKQARRRVLSHPIGCDTFKAPVWRLGANGASCEAPNS